MSILTPTGRAGEFTVNATGQKIMLTDWEVGSLYDTVAIDSGIDLSNGKLEFYLGIGGGGSTRKTDLDTNVRDAGKLPSHNQFICLRPSFFVLPIWGDAAPAVADQASIYASGVGVWNKNERPIMTKRVLWEYPSGYGVVAYGLDPAASVDIAPTSLGVASPAAQPPLLVPFQLSSEDSFGAVIEFPGSNAGVEFNSNAAPTYNTNNLSVATAIMASMHGFSKRPATN